MALRPPHASTHPTDVALTVMAGRVLATHGRTVKGRIAFSCSPP